MLIVAMTMGQNAVSFMEPLIFKYGPRLTNKKPLMHDCRPCMKWPNRMVVEASEGRVGRFYSDASIWPLQAFSQLAWPAGRIASIRPKAGTNPASFEELQNFTEKGLL